MKKNTETTCSHNSCCAEQKALISESPFNTEERVRERWKSQRLLEKMEKNSTQTREPFELVDGPPFPTGNPHSGTLLVSTLKDMVLRSKSLLGHPVAREWNWDSHGMPAETKVEQLLGIDAKRDIGTTISLTDYISACKKLNKDANDSWEYTIDRLGRAVDLTKAKYTMDTEFMESTVHAFKTLHDKGLIYEGEKVTPYCYNCQTTLSISDTRESDSTRPREDRDVTLQIPVGVAGINRPVIFLVWTTTPWSVMANMGLAVNRDLTYVLVEDGYEYFLLGEKAYETNGETLFDMPRVVSILQGSDLIGSAYQSPFKQSHEECDTKYVYDANFVTEDGTAILHVAPAYGSDDHELGVAHQLEIYNPVGIDGRYQEGIKEREFIGLHVHKDVDRIIEILANKGLIFHSKKIEHNYPHCWRCRTPLIYQARPAYYLNVEKIKPRLLELNQSVNWIPESVNQGRFIPWLEGAKDWCISRNRYFSTPIPIWKCDKHSHHQRVFGSKAEIEEASGIKLDDLHMDKMDDITFQCDCGGTMHRTEEVLDCWFEAASVPFARKHYPFQYKDQFEQEPACDLVIEYIGQVRCWFYYLHVMHVALFDSPAFKNVMVHGTVLASDGKKISKSQKNYTDPQLLIDKYGADAFRGYLVSSPAIGPFDLFFKDDGIVEINKTLISPLKSAYNFFQTYAEIDCFDGDANHLPHGENVLDAWLINKTIQTMNEMHSKFEQLELVGIMKPAISLIEEVNNWYIRRSRKRFWNEERNDDKTRAYETLFFVLTRLCQILSPVIPFITDEIYMKLTGNSVHLSQWKKLDEPVGCQTLFEEMELAKKVCALGHSVRNRLKLKVKQPLYKVTVVQPGSFKPILSAPLKALICAELNVHEVETKSDLPEDISRQFVPNGREISKKYKGDTATIIANVKRGRYDLKANKLIVNNGEGREWVLSGDMYSVGFSNRSGHKNTEHEGDIIVVLDDRVSTELKEQMIAAELTRKIQLLRKDSGLQVQQRIELQIDGPVDDVYRDKIAQETLAVLVRHIGEAANEDSFHYENCDYRVRIRQASEPRLHPAIS